MARKRRVKRSKPKTPKYGKIGAPKSLKRKRFLASIRKKRGKK